LALRDGPSGLKHKEHNETDTVSPDDLIRGSGIFYHERHLSIDAFKGKYLNNILS